MVCFEMERREEVFDSANPTATSLSSDLLSSFSSFSLCTFFILFRSTGGSLDNREASSLELGATEAISSSFEGGD